MEEEHRCEQATLCPPHGWALCGLMWEWWEHRRQVAGNGAPVRIGGRRRSRPSDDTVVCRSSDNDPPTLYHFCARSSPEPWGHLLFGIILFSQEQPGIGRTKRLASQHRQLPPKQGHYQKRRITAVGKPPSSDHLTNYSERAACLHVWSSRAIIGSFGNPTGVSWISGASRRRTDPAHQCPPDYQTDR